MVKINPIHIVSVSYTPLTEITGYHYTDEIVSTLIGKTRKIGWYSDIWDEPYKIMDDDVVIDGKLYRKPYVTIRMVDGSTHIRYFDNNPLAVNFYNFTLQTDYIEL